MNPIEIIQIEELTQEYVNKHNAPNATVNRKKDLFFIIMELYEKIKDVSDNKDLMQQVANLTTLY